MMTVISALLDTIVSTVVDVLPIALIIFGFQFLVIRQRPANLTAILLGFVWVLIGLSFFLLGLEWCLFPLGRSMASQLTARPIIPYPPKYALNSTDAKVTHGPVSGQAVRGGV